MHNGMQKKEIQQKLSSFLLECDPKIVLLEWEDLIDRSIKNAKKYPIIIIDSVVITEPEMEMIDALHGRQLRRLAFTLLCIAKYRCAATGEKSMWVNNPDNEIMKMANINTSITRQCALFAKLRELGMIRFSKRVDNTSVEVLFAQDGKAAMEIRDFRNLGYQYLMFHGESYYVCSECGITEKENSPSTRGPKKKYCRECAAKIKIRQSVNSVMKKRHDPKAS